MSKGEQIFEIPQSLANCFFDLDQVSVANQGKRVYQNQGHEKRKMVRGCALTGLI